MIRNPVSPLPLLAVGLALMAGPVAPVASQALDRVVAATSAPGEAAGDSASLLGEPFESRSAGIALRPPAGSVENRGLGTGDEIVEFVNERRQWSLKVGRTALMAQPLPLANWKDSFGQDRPGFLEQTANQLRSSGLGAEILRNDIINLSSAEAGMIAARYTSVKGQRRLTQQALLQVSDQLYYVLSFTTPGARLRPATTAPAPATAQEEEDAEERLAVETFRAVLDSVRLLDRTGLRDDQNQRLYRTRSELLRFTPDFLKSLIVEQQWFRLQRDGRDIGYTCVFEEIDRDRRRGEEGLMIRLRTRTVPEPGVQVDVGSQMFVTFDRKHEAWAHVVVSESKKNEGPRRTYGGEFGTSDRILKTVMDPRLEKGEKRPEGFVDEKQPSARQVESTTLSVKYVGKEATAEPVVRMDLPPWYLPEALGYMLPRLLSLREPKGFLFAVYVSDRREVMARYLDVGREQETVFAGRRIRAVPIEDRVTLDGPVTVHYMSPGGRYLGSQSKDGRTCVVPTDADTLKKLWGDAKLTRPEDLRPPQEK